jgi:hypothetical protein
MNWKEFLIKLLVIVVSFIYPFVLMSVEGELGSISQYWNTSLQPLFIAANVMTAYFFFSIDNWKLPSYFLVLLTAFSIQLYPVTHDVIATLFFISCLIPLFKTKRFKFYAYFYFFSIPIGLFWGLLWLEIWGMFILCSYHLHTLIYTMLVFHRKIKIEEELDNY